MCFDFKEIIFMVLLINVYEFMTKGYFFSLEEKVFILKVRKNLKIFNRNRKFYMYWVLKNGFYKR